MRFTDLAILYLVVGAGCAIWTARAKPATRGRDIPLMLVLWPVFVPFALADGGRHASTDPSANALLAALGAFADGPFATLLPGPRTVDTIAARVRLALERIARIDTLLATPDLDEASLARRLEAFRGARDETSAAAVAGRLAAVARLKSLKERSEREVVQVRELLAQLAVQAEVVRLSGGDGAAAKATVQELVARSEGLASVLESGDLDGALAEPRV